jgi:DNA-binding transcriptional MerR regulator
MTSHGELTSGQAAAAAGVSRKAMRIYEEKGLVMPCGRTPAGYRLYGADEINTLRFIRRARLLGLGLDEIAGIVAQHHRGGPVCPNVKRRLTERVQEIDQTIRDLEALRQNLVRSISECTTEAIPDVPSWCPIVDRVAAGE